MLLFPEGISAEACGKTILIGEHAVVYGHCAIAVALPQVKLKINVRAGAGPSCWLDAWLMNGETFGQGELLTQVLENALQLQHKCLSDFSPQWFNLDSHIPLGAGLGGSAALSVAMLRLFDPRPRWQDANMLDAIFHGKASGIDVATILAQGVVEYSKESGFRPLVPAKTLYLALADTGGRKRTSEMVAKVASQNAEGILQQLGAISQALRVALVKGELDIVGRYMNEAHGLLTSLGVSCDALDAAVVRFRRAGALGAKLTGAGGGGMALALFAADPRNSPNFDPLWRVAVVAGEQHD